MAYGSSGTTDEQNPPRNIPTYIPGPCPLLSPSLEKQEACGGGSSVTSVEQYCNEGYEGPRELGGPIFSWLRIALSVGLLSE